MRKKIFWKILLLVSVINYAQPTHSKKVVGYYAQWAIYARDYNINKIDGNKLTHLNYAFFDVDYSATAPQNTKLKSLDTYADFEHTETGAPWNAPVKGNFYDLKNLKTAYPHLKILISVGGWTRSQKLPLVAADPAARTALANDMANFLVTYPFIDGFDIDWEYPVRGGTDGTETINWANIPAQPHTVDDHKNFVLLVKAMRQAMPNKLITIAAGNNVNDVVDQYIGPNNRPAGFTEDLTTYCDFITFFGYDFGGNWYDKTCYNAPLYGSGNASDPLHNATKPQSLDKLVDIYLNQIGIPANKLVMGLPFYGKLFNNVSGTGSVPGLPGLFVSAPRVTTGGCANPIPPQGTWDTITCEFSGSVEFCDLSGGVGTTPHHYLNPGMDTVNSTAAAAGWVRYWDNTCKVPYLYNQTTNQFVTYDDKQSIDEKCKFIMNKNLAGGMIWELSQDTRESNSVVLLTQINTTFSTLGTNDFDNELQSQTKIFFNNNQQLEIKSNQIIDKVSVYSILGTTIFSMDNINETSTSIANTSLSKKQVYIVRTNFKNGSTVTKKIIN